MPLPDRRLALLALAALLEGAPAFADPPVVTPAPGETTLPPPESQPPLPAPMPDVPASPPAPAPATEAELEIEQKKEKARPLMERLLVCDDGTDRSRGWLRNFATGDHPPTAVFDTPCDLGWHKPIYFLPYSYSPDYDGAQTEVVFQVSAKLRPFGPPLYFAYSQKSFWQVYDTKRSRPFRETVYNPEMFYRWTPDFGKGWNDFGSDLGIEHESNGRDVPQSRSWNRVYLAPFYEHAGTAIQLKVWYRLPESKKKDPEDASGDDNPHIEDFYGWAELNVFRRIGTKSRWHLMTRLNPDTGKGAINLEYSWRLGHGDVFGIVYAFHGYGESLMDYNNSVTRVGFGFSLAR